MVKLKELHAFNEKAERQKQIILKQKSDEKYKKLKKYNRIKQSIDELWFKLEETYDLGKITKMEDHLADQLKVLEQMKQVSTLKLKLGGK